MERKDFCSFGNYGWHKGFYNDEDVSESLFSIRYSDFFVEPDNDEFPYHSAYLLLCGACHIFALSLQNLLNYNAYIIEEKNQKGFHTFCQVYKKGKWYYIDARGITTSFDEFMDIAGEFVCNEYSIRPISENDIRKWQRDSNYDKEAYDFAEAVIRKFKECYVI